MGKLLKKLIVLALTLVASSVMADVDNKLKSSIEHSQKVIAQAQILELQKIAFDAMQARAKELGYSESDIEASPALMGLFTGAVESMELEAQKLHDMTILKNEG